MGRIDARRQGIGARDWRMTSGTAEVSAQPANGLIADIIEGIKTHLTTLLVDVPVIGGFPDERVSGEAARAYPCVSITIIGMSRDTNSKYSGMGVVRYDNPDIKTADLVREPIPILLQIQIDTLAENLRDDWRLTEIVLPLLEAHVKITTAMGRTVYPSLMEIANLDGLEAGLWRKTYRFSVTAWFDHPSVPETAFIVTQLQIQSGNEIIVLDE